MKRKKLALSENPIDLASTSSTSSHVGDYEGETKKHKGNDYEVFLSFRGKDTRKGLTDYLYTSLVDAGIHVFRDDNELRVGEEIGPELLCSIAQSKISIPIISENYASSKWCLCELAQILKCKRSRGQIVLPIFYKVEPSHVRHLTGRLGDAINVLKEHLDEMVVKEWEEALKEVSSLKGWESEKIDNGHEGALVKIIVRKVLSELKKTFQLMVPKELVGIDDRVEEIMRLIDARFIDTRVIGIYGMGGIGKTTLARVLYNNLSGHFQHLSFVANIRETSLRKGIECLQKQLIDDILRSSYHVSNVDEGIGVIKSRFTSKKVLILLDDMDDNTHLNALVGDGSWFKAGSIVIITTRNKSILDAANAGYMYKLNELPLDQSLILFSRHAFRKDSPQSDYEALSHDVVSTTGGLPLALEVIGSFLCGKREEVWKDTLQKLNTVPDKKVQDKLRISYESLDYEEQQIFLDIACFFIGSSKQSPTYMWDACGFFPRKGIEILSLMSLIKIDKDGKLGMHDQLRDLGREIVRLENKKKPQMRSRFWICEEAVDVLDNNKGTRNIEALRLGKDGWERRYTGKQFRKLTNLRFLQVDGASFTGNFQNLLSQLRWLQWEGCPSDFAAVNFHLKKLVVLDLSRSNISEDWEGWGQLMMATELKVLNLSSCHRLRRTPDLSAFQSLEILTLENCENLEEIHPSIEDIKALVSLDVRCCGRLEELPTGVGKMKELRYLLLDETAIQEVPISKGCLMKLETLHAWCCMELAQLPKSMDSLVSLTQLDLSHSGIEELPESMGSLVSLTQLDLSHSGIEKLPESIGSLKKLETLDVSDCASLACIPRSIGHLASLRCLLLQECWSLREIPNSIGKLASLIELDLRSTSIRELPESIGSLMELEILDASNCASLVHIPSSIVHLASLQRLLLGGCCSLKEIPNSIGNLASLTVLDLKSTKILELPESIGSLKEIETLDVSNCASLAHIPSSIGHLTSLSLLNLSKCDKLAQLPDSIGSLVSLQHLLLQGCCLLREIPDSIGKLTSLTVMDLKSTAIVELPKSIGSLRELKTLDASCCASLTCIPSSIGHLTSLSLLDLRFSSKLAQLPDSIGSLVSLQCLLLRECCLLREIPHSIGKLTSLTALDLKSTAIVELPSSIRNLQNLKILDIRGTQITELPGTIKILQNAEI